MQISELEWSEFMEWMAEILSRCIIGYSHSYWKSSAG